MNIARSLTFSLCILSAASLLRAEGRLHGPLRQYASLTIDFDGPQASETGATNPFTDIRLDVIFTNGGNQFVVPGYFAADGDAGNSGADAGSVWRVHFTPDSPGEWSYEARFAAGELVAVAENNDDASQLDEYHATGSFTVARDPSARGVLHYVGGRYLQFSGDGSYFLKSGADSPENFLGYADFDATYSQKRRNRSGEADQGGLHRYEPHLRDWQAGDPTWGEGRGKGIIGAVNYLRGVGVNSIYMLTMNIEGDGYDLWPYVSHKEPTRFDCSKLDQWDVVFSHMDSLDMLLHIILTETENEAWFEVVEGETDFADLRKLYYREVIARFGHHRAVVWNLGEENGWDNKNKDGEPLTYGGGNTDQQRMQFASYIKAVDPYDHPIVVHTLPGDYDRIYTPLLGFKDIDGPSLQIKLNDDIHGETLKWVRRSAENGRPWFVCFDELGPAGDGVLPDAEDPRHDEVRKLCLWGNLMAGGSGCEWYFGYQHAHNDLNLEDFRSRAEMWRQTKIAVDFFQQHLPFTLLEPADEIVSSDDGAYCMAQGDELFVVYAFGEPVTIKLSENGYDVYTFDPLAGGGLTKRGDTQGGEAEFECPFDQTRDYILVLKRK